ncbi:MAG: tRNA (adenosine(37)-N6)-dimethylallyltransferase MiaA [Alphaproteobacteria bacterium]|nr:tRNA (adenosine(37)-N6)-dimethylallyltransferase MiaA [Alphaproteobacteria bacterium]
MTQNKQTIHVIGGPTASGKSACALEFATKYDGVIINADSMQVYDGLPILTAQPSAQDKALCPHLLYGALHPNESCSAGNWKEMVEPIIHALLCDGKTPIIVGGSGLYIKALVEGLSPIPDIPQDIRDAAGEKQRELGNPNFHAKLTKRDPVMGARLEPFNTARLVRAWEVLEATGKSLSEWQDIPPLSPPENWEFHITLVMPERDRLYDRCNRRFEWMLENGALEELEDFNNKIQRQEINENALLAHALGVDPLRAYLNGELSREKAIELGQRETRQYAKRQVTWFKHQIKNNKNVAYIEKIP